MGWGVGERSEHVWVPFGPWRFLESSANSPLTLLWRTVRTVLALRQHPRKAGLMGRNMVTEDWLFQLTPCCLSTSLQPLGLRLSLKASPYRTRRKEG